MDCVAFAEANNVLPSVVLYATYNEVVDKLAEHEWKGHYMEAVDMLKGYFKHKVDAEYEVAPGCQCDIFKYDHAAKTWAVISLTPDPMCGGHELRELEQDVPCPVMLPLALSLKS